MKRAGRVGLFCAALAFVIAPVLSQTKSQTTPKPTFEITSVKPSPPNLNIRGGGARGDRLTLTGVSLRVLLQQAYSRPSADGGPGSVIIQIVGGPNWIDSDLFEINAKADCTGGPIAYEQTQLMTQAMLEDRFQLKAHFDTRELPVYNLVVGKEGSKVKFSSDQTPPAIVQAGPPRLCAAAPPVALPEPPPPPRSGAPGQVFTPPPPPRGALRMMLGPTGMTLQATATPFANFITALSQFAGRPVIDKTGLKGFVDVTLQFSQEGITLPGGPLPGPRPGGPGAPVDTAADPTPSLFTAIQELGLRLESSKGPVEVLVIDSAEKPTEN
jgi:uncharacterized protein (TIGR03435 family)